LPLTVRFTVVCIAPSLVGAAAPRPGASFLRRRPWVKAAL
jgi:hypothetical protein